MYRITKLCISFISKWNARYEVFNDITIGVGNRIYYVNKQNLALSACFQMIHHGIHPFFKVG